MLQMRGSVAPPRPGRTRLNVIYAMVSMHADGFLLRVGERNTFGLTVDKAFPVSGNELMQQLKSLFILLLPT